ncbi:MAG TPA: AAA family ATPase [Elusimicrobiales bacterium]|nr:AAA family ATPase [Elusimicrobiales bacterium]
MRQTDKLENAATLPAVKGKALASLRSLVVGQDEAVEQLLISLFARGHALLVGVPGLAKTLMVSTLASILDLSFSRIQFTPDLMPSDILGCEVLRQDPRTGAREIQFIRGPVFANVVLADEINRTPPKTQSALLEAMQEGRVTSGGETRPLPAPFMVLATQNPIEQEGTYPLPEAQLDRFLLQVNISYPSMEEEKRIVAMTTAAAPAPPPKVLSARDLSALQEAVREAEVTASVLDYAVRLARATRPQAGSELSRLVTWGAGPRASQSLVLAAKARAVLDGRFAVSAGDIKAVAAPVLRHRLVLSFQAEAEGVRPDDLIAGIMAGLD